MAIQQRGECLLPVFPRVLSQQFQIAHHFQAYRRRRAKSDKIYRLRLAPAVSGRIA
jgi:hypothetical protein